MAEVRPFNIELGAYEVSEQDKLERTVTLDDHLAVAEDDIDKLQDQQAALAFAQASDEQKLVSLDAAQVSHLSDYNAHAVGTYLRAHVDNGVRHIPGGSIAVPKPPAAGRYTLVSQDGALSWVPFENSPPEPSTGVWWGMYPKPAAGQTFAEAVAAREAWMGRKLGAIRHYSDASTVGAGVLGDPRVVSLIDQGYPIFESMTTRLYSGGNYTWAQVRSGAIDVVLHTAGQRLRNVGKPVWFSVDIEFDGSGFTSEVQTDFVPMWRHVYDVIVNQEGASNVRWFWNPTGYSGNWSKLQTLYPGDDVVHLIAWDPYETKLPIPTTPEIDTYRFYEHIEAATWHGPKPYMLAEYGCNYDSANPDARKGWLERVPEALKALPKIVAVLYFDSSYQTVALNDVSSKQGFASAGQDPYVNPGG